MDRVIRTIKPMKTQQTEGISKKKKGVFFRIVYKFSIIKRRNTIDLTDYDEVF